jgi:lysophospholipase L1-like esterase
MDRRTALAWMIGLTAAGCGGGGGGGGTNLTTSGAGTAAAPAPAPAPVPAPAPTAAVQLSRNIACWGDSLTGPMAPNLQLLVPDRTVFDGGITAQTSEQILAREQADPHSTWINTFWMGHNNNTEPEQIKADILASVALLAPGNTHFIVLGLNNKALPTEAPGSAEYNVIVTLNQQLAQMFPNNFIDIRSYLVSQYDPNSPQDVQDHANDFIPSSLRFDEIHLNNNGSILVAQRVKAFIDAQGW